MRRSLAAELIGASAAITEAREEIALVARSDAKVLITGESGVGKELVSRAVHFQSARAQYPFVAVNCAGLPETLLESELFGHAKGSFTGAYRDKPGKLEMADRGTVLLHEVVEMSLRMQSLLFPLLEPGELTKVGSERTARTVNVRVIAATNRISWNDRAGPGSVRTLLPAQRHPHRSAAPGPPGRHSALVDQFLQQFTGNGRGPVHCAGGDQGAGELSWPKRPRARKRDRRLVVSAARRSSGWGLPPNMARRSAP